MLKNVILRRPLAVIDLETTGVKPEVDRIVEISILKLLPGEQGRSLPNPVHLTVRCNPCVPIPEGASAIHGIYDADVADAPSFKARAPKIVAFLDGCDLCGYNIRGFDLPMLIAELERSGSPLSLLGRKLIDVMVIYHKRETRTLTDALRFYCGREHTGAHGAQADVLASAAILDAIVDHYEDLPCEIDALHALHVSKDAIDLEGKFQLIDGHTTFAFGKHAGHRLADIARDDPSYLTWVLNGTFLSDVKELVRDALRGDSVPDAAW